MEIRESLSSKEVLAGRVGQKFENSLEIGVIFESVEHLRGREGLGDVRDRDARKPLENAKSPPPTLGPPNLGDRIWGALARPRGPVPHSSTAFGNGPTAATEAFFLYTRARGGPGRSIGPVSSALISNFSAWLARQWNGSSRSVGAAVSSFVTMKLMTMGIYLALVDSISIDDYTGVRGGGAASQLARNLGLDLVDLMRDGNTTHGVLADLAGAPASADVVTLTAGGNDLLGGDLPRAILRRLDQIARRIHPLGASVVINNIYDPSDGDNELGRRELGLSRLATIELRRRLNAVNRGIAKLADEHGFLLADLERLFNGHGVASEEPWFVKVIEPNLAGATATAEHWQDLLISR